MQAYTYDPVNRLASATETKGGSAQWSRSYSYDHSGNRWISGATGHTLHSATPTSSAAIEAATNRLASTTGAVYDNAGNMTAHPFITPGGGGMSYDANNKMTAFTATGVSVNTLYDATGKRVRKVHNGQTTVWVYDAFGRLAAEYTTATLYDTPGTYYRTTDHLGSTRLVTDEAGAVKQRRDYFPFGEEIEDTLSGRGAVEDGGVGTYNASLSLRQQFTGHERDEETGLDDMKARKYQPCLARFLSVDPANAGAALWIPQSWNAYSYVNGRPMVYNDPSGRCPNNPNAEPNEDGSYDCGFSFTTDVVGEYPSGSGGYPSGSYEMDRIDDERVQDARAAEDRRRAQRISEAVEGLMVMVEAAKILLQNPDCASLFSGGDPIAVLESIVNSNEFGIGNVTWWDELPAPAPSGARAFVAPALPGLYPIGTVTFHLQIDFFRGFSGYLTPQYPNYGGRIIIHELGHAFDFLPGFDSEINTLWDAISAPFGGAGSRANDNLVDRRCSDPPWTGSRSVPLPPVSGERGRGSGPRGSGPRGSGPRGR